MSLKSNAVEAKTEREQTKQKGKGEESTAMKGRPREGAGGGEVEEVRMMKGRGGKGGGEEEEDNTSMKGRVGGKRGGGGVYRRRRWR